LDDGADDDNDGGGPPGSGGGGGGNGIDELTGEVTDRNGQHHPIAEFLYQLTKMLTDDNTEVIEWSDGRIKVHHPERLEAEVLHKYFRHSKVR
jgi:HSF-type DNA-binding